MTTLNRVAPRADDPGMSPVPLVSVIIPAFKPQHLVNAITSAREQTCADIVLAADTDDLFERRALIAAATGATVVTARRGGPAATFAGAHHDLAAALAHADTTARAERRAVVLAATDQTLIAARVTGLVQRGVLAA